MGTDGKVVIGAEIDTKQFDAQIDYIESRMLDIEDQLKQADMGFEVGDTQKLESDYERLGNQLLSLRGQQDKLNESLNNMSRARLENVEKQLGKIGNSITKITKKVGHWALAIFGIRSAYLAVRGAMSTLTQYDKNLAADIEYIRYALANALKPVIEAIISLVYKLLSYINYIAQAWFGVNLFANASAKAFEKQKKSLSGSAKAAKEMKNQLAGFDEMNVLQDNSSAGGGGGGAAATGTPGFDLSKLQGDVPGWIKWIADNGEVILGVLLGIVTALTLMKLGMDALTATGIGVIVAGVVMLIKDIVDFIKDPSWQGFIKILGDIAIIIGGIMLVMGNWWGLLVIIVGAVIKLVANNWDKIKEILGAIGGWIYDHIIKPVADFFKAMWDGIVTGAKAVWEGIKAVFSGFAEFFKHIFTDAWNGIKKLFSAGGKIFNGLKEGIVDSFKAIVNTLITGINKLIALPFKAINKLFNKIRSLSIAGIHPFKFIKKDLLPIPEIPKLAKGGIINQPGRGVPVGYSALGGEKGAEGVIPLTDSQQMAMLGEAIGKYITVNATVINSMNGRVISREMQKINNESDFAFNR